MRSIIAATSFLLAACGPSGQAGPAPAPASPASAKAGPTAIGQPLPSLAFPVLDGGDWVAASARGQVLVIDVWATFCQPCLKAFPKLERWMGSYPGMELVGISVDEEDGVVREFLEQTPVSFTIVRDPTLSVRDGPLGVTKLPTLLIVDRHGMVRFRRDEMSVADYDEAEAVLASLLASYTE